MSNASTKQSQITGSGLRPFIASFPTSGEIAPPFLGDLGIIILSEELQWGIQCRLSQLILLFTAGD